MPDGSYGTETIVLDDPAKAKLQNINQSEDSLPLRKAIISTEDDYLASCLAVTLTKLAIKTKKNFAAHSKYNQIVVDSILITCALLKGQQKKKHADPDSKSRMQLCLRILSNPLGLQSISSIESIIVDQGRKIFAKFLEGHSKLNQVTNKLGGLKDDTLLIT